MRQGDINFDEIKKESLNLHASSEEASVACKSMGGLMTELCNKNDAPSIKRASDGVLETTTAFLKAVEEEMVTVDGMVQKAANLESTMS